jgi:trehalose/maltose transport system substrate-binding protein
MKWTALLANLITGVALGATSVDAAELHVVVGIVGDDLRYLQKQFGTYEKKTGDRVTIVPMPASTSDSFAQYRLWLAAGATNIDLYFTDVIWAPQLAPHFVDLADAAQNAGLIKANIPSIIQSQIVGGKLVALPVYTDAAALYYRKDLLEKYNLPVPKTWTQMASEAKTVMEGERAAGARDMWGFVFQGDGYEGLTCNALEWINSYRGGEIVEPDGTISVNNANAVAALKEAKSWIGTIAPEGVLGYKEEESRGVWQLGNAVFMRNWPYAYALGNGDDSPIKGKFAVSALPSGGDGFTPAATLGGWNVAVSKYSPHEEAAIKLALYLGSPEFQKGFAVSLAHLPTIASVYDDPDVAAAQPIVAKWKNVVLNAVPRPSAPTKDKYNEVSSDFWTAVRNTMSGQGSAEDSLEILEAQLIRLKGAGW